MLPLIVFFLRAPVVPLSSGLTYSLSTEGEQKIYSQEKRIHLLSFQFLVKHTVICNIFKTLNQKIREINYQKSSEIRHWNSGG